MPPSTTSAASSTSTSSSIAKAPAAIPIVKLPCWCGDDCQCCIVSKLVDAYLPSHLRQSLTSVSSVSRFLAPSCREERSDFTILRGVGLLIIVGDGGAHRDRGCQKQTRPASDNHEKSTRANWGLDVRCSLSCFRRTLDDSLTLQRRSLCRVAQSLIVIFVDAVFNSHQNPTHRVRPPLHHHHLHPPSRGRLELPSQ